MGYTGEISLHTLHIRTPLLKVKLTIVEKWILIKASTSLAG